MINIKSYLHISFICLIIFTILELSNQLFNNYYGNKNTNNNNKNPVPNSTISKDDSPKSEMATSTQPNIIGFAREQDLENTKYGIFHKGSKDELPFEGLEPKEFISRLNYIYYATANPYEPISYQNYKTHADKVLNKDGTSLITDDQRLLSYGRFYPQLTKDMIDARDCLNEGSGAKSCFQSTQLFENVKNGFKSTPILNQGVNNNNKDLIIKEDFTNPMIMDPNFKFMPLLFKNAPGVQDVNLDSTSNERIKLQNNREMLCNNCKLAVCQDDYCSLQNQLFM